MPTIVNWLKWAVKRPVRGRQAADASPQVQSALPKQPYRITADEPAQRKPQSRWPLWALIGVIILYAGIWISLTVPYRLLPCDDLRFWTYMNHASGFESFAKAEPTTVAFMQAAYSLFGAGKSTMILYTVASYIGIMITLAYLARRLTASWHVALFSALLFVCCAWPVTYLIMVSYSAFMTMCGWLTWALLAYSLLSARGSIVPAILAGITFIGAVGCSSAAALNILGLGVMCLGLIRHPLTGRWNLRPVISFSASVLVLGILFWFNFKDGYLARIAESYNDPSVLDGIRRYGLCFDAPFSIPFPSALWVLWSYSKILASALVITSVLALGSCLRALLTRPRPAPDLLRRFLGILAVAIWVEVIPIDILGTPKSGRSHFLWFPCACLLIALSIGWFASLLPPRRKWVMGLCGFLVVAGSTIEMVPQCSRIWHEKYALPRELQKHHRDASSIYVLFGDPHAFWIKQWLEDWPITPISPEDLLAQVKSGHSGEYVALVGPSGPGSGRSFLMHSCLPDYLFPVDEFVKNSHASVKIMPYFSFDPSFAHEERVTQGLFYQGRIPDPAVETDKNIRLLYWPPTSGTGPMSALTSQERERRTSP